ncbi:MAG: U32 family peptidase [Deltaproteobacteria bacterium]|nr:U32 family peptidase [Deltaproteobacteria bacterium]
MQLTLGPILYEWKKDDVMRFYDAAASLDVDTVCIGEVVCAKRRALTLKDAASIGETLRKAGKKVVISTLAVVSNEADLGLVREALSLPFAIEANDMSVFGISETMGLKKEIFAGPHLETYNKEAIEFLKTLGVGRVSFPVELSVEAIKCAVEGTGVEAEVFGFGRPPLAFSWRCYTCRAHGITKDECKNDCAKYPEGIELKTLGKDDVFTVNGTSVLGSRPVSLAKDAAGLGSITSLRLSPEKADMKKVVDVFRRCLLGEDAAGALDELYPHGFLNGYAFSAAGRDFIGRVA